MPTCHNCKAECPTCGTDPHGKPICCAGCLFNTLGCRCKYGEFGVLETFVPDFDEDDPDFEDSDDDGDDVECGMICGRGGRPEGCAMAGTEHCDFVCPNRNFLYESLNKRAKRKA